jgi:NADH-quinone oxidoreductase subunit M
VIALAVPGSSAFAGEFLVLAGVFQQYWVYAAVGAAAIVLAAMYMLRLISGVLHREVGSAVSDAARDLVPGELAVLLPLVGCLIALSAWPAAVSEHSFPQAITLNEAVAAAPPAATRPTKFRPPRTPAVPHGSMSTEGGNEP